ncbi:MAG: MerC domain-containing protein [Bacteriovoracaceae bacterium]|jgi:hypothetical protein
MKKAWDKIGIALSSLCIVHCIGLAILPALLPTLGHLGIEFHLFMSILILVTSPLAFIPGYKKHGVSMVIMWAMAGLSMILLGTFMEEKFPEWLSHSVTIVGSITLVYAHFLNIKHSRHNHCCDH